MAGDGAEFSAGNRSRADGPVPSTVDAAQDKKNRPKASQLRQQQLPAWQPILTASTVIPTIFLIGIIFIPIGIALFLASHKVQEWSTYYENCSQPTCTIKFDLTEPFFGDVYFYYGLENYFQNHRRYMKSRNDKQLMGFLEEISECEPFSKVGDTVIAPCGAIANSMFNDTFKLTREGSMDQIPWNTNGLVWTVDRNTKFRNPVSDGEAQDLCAAFRDTVKPPNWKKSPCELDPKNEDNNGFKNVDFMIWMRTAALPDFRKPYRALDRNNPTYAAGLPQGSYILTIVNNYPVTPFAGRKSFIISTTTWAGGRNSFLGYAYIVVGGICIILGVVFLVVHIKFGHHLSQLAEVH